MTPLLVRTDCELKLLTGDARLLTKGRNKRSTKEGKERGPQRFKDDEWDIQQPGDHDVRWGDKFSERQTSAARRHTENVVAIADIAFFTLTALLYPQADGYT